MLQEFKTFIMRGNVIDLAVGVVIGGAFGKIVNSLVEDIIMPPIGLLISGIDFKDLTIRIGGEDSAPVLIKYGNFIQISIQFVIIAFAIFIVVKGINKMRDLADKKKEAEAPAPAPPAPSAEEVLLAEIRDLLKKQA
jgi:large conductance mechanosensitive channel